MSPPAEKMEDYATQPHTEKKKFKFSFFDSTKEKLYNAVKTCKKKKKKKKKTKTTNQKT